MKYWAFLLAKFALAVTISGALLRGVNLIWPDSFFGYDLLYTTMTGIVFLLAYGLFYLTILDQRYRCRVCVRRLRMPVETGSWSRMLQFGRPRMEYICTFGHGKLNVEEIQFTGTEHPKWKQHQDMWKELYEMADADKDR